MSWKALAWASGQKCEKAADKLILLALAERHNTETRIAYPSIAWLVEFSSLDRKTVLKSLARLQAKGLIIDSGDRMGATGRVKAWMLAHDGGTVPKTGPLKQSRFSHEMVPFFPETVPKTVRLNGPKNGTRNQDMGTCINRDITRDARATRKRSALPKNFKPELTGKASEIVAAWPPSRLAHEIDAFRNYHLAKGSLMADWQAAFRTWIGNAEKWSKKNGNRDSNESLADIALGELRERGKFD